MNKRELGKVAKALAQNLPECAAAGDLVVRIPLGPILQALCLQRSGWEPRNFYVWVFFQPLCIPKTDVFFNLGWRLGGGTHAWNCHTPVGLAALAEAIRREALPFLDRVQSPRDAALTAKILDRRVVEQMLVGVATRQYGRSLEPVGPEMKSRGPARAP